MDAGATRFFHSRLWPVAVVALLYGAAHLSWYWTTPLGRNPVLDERENLQLAAQIADGTLPAEPFYRATGYPLLLAGLKAAGILAEGYPQAATALGLLLHVLNTWLVARLARRWFDSDRAAWLAGLLHGLNPVLVHYATQILDAVPSVTCCLAGLLCLPARRDDPPDARRAAALSLAWAAAALIRPQLLLLWLVFPLVWLAATGWRRNLRPLLAGLAAGAALGAAQGAWAWRISGEFRLLPWQGAYNLWAANRPGANGRYYTQSMAVPASAQHRNPARIEAEALYRTATGDAGPLRIGALNAYWQSRLLAELAAAPGAGAALLLRKLVFLAGDFEQYNNKTYSFHQARSPWLRWNFLGWGLLLLAAVPSAVHLGRRGAPLGIAAAAIAAGILLSYASARFRLPLTALLCVLAGGTCAHWRTIWPTGFGSRAMLTTALGALAVLTYSNAFDGRSRTTYLQDHLLIALAAERLGEDQVAWTEAAAALALNPQHVEAQRLLLASGFNQLLRGAEIPEAVWLETARRVPAPLDSPAANLIALALWRANDPTGVALWRQRWHERADPEALAALSMARLATAAENERLAALPLAESPLQLLARARRDPAQPAELREAADRVFPRP